MYEDFHHSTIGPVILSPGNIVCRLGHQHYRLSHQASLELQQKPCVYKKICLTNAFWCSWCLTTDPNATEFPPLHYWDVFLYAWRSLSSAAPILLWHGLWWHTLSNCGPITAIIQDSTMKPLTILSGLDNSSPSRLVFCIFLVFTFSNTLQLCD